MHSVSERSKFIVGARCCYQKASYSCSSIVQADTGAEYQRNRHYLLQSSEPPEQIVDLPDEQETVTDETIPPPQQQCTETSKVNTDVTRKDSTPVIDLFFLSLRK